METGSFALDENLLGVPQNIFNNGHSSEDFLLLITSVEDLQLRCTNSMANDYFRSHLKTNKSRSCFFSKIIHPEDFATFKNSLEIKSSGFFPEQKQVVIRIRSPFGYWKKYAFRNRLYTGFGGCKGKHVLSLAFPVDPTRERHQKDSAGNIETEKTLQESLSRYRALVNSLDQGYAIIDLIVDTDHKPTDYFFVETNAVFERYTQGEAQLGRTMKETYPNHEDNWFSTFHKVAATGDSIRFESYAKAHQKWFDVFAFPIGKKTSRKIAVLFSDISQRKKSEQKLKQVNENLEYTVRKRTQELEVNNELLQMVFDTASEGIFLLKPFFGDNFDIVDFTYVRANKKISRYYKQDMVGRRFLEMNPQATQDGSFEVLKQTMLTGASNDFEVKIGENRKQTWFKITTRRQRGLLVNTLKNITRKKLQNQKLKASIRFNKQLIETSPDIILIFNLYSQQIKYINRQLSQTPGLSRHSLENMPLEKILPLIHPQDRERTLEFHEKLMLASDKDLFEIEFRLKGPGHTWDFYCARGKVFMRNAKGNVSEYIVLLRNVQEQKLTQQALIKAEKLSIKGEIARTLAHELRNPIASIGMSADILEKHTEDPVATKLKNYIRIIKRSTTTLNNLVTDLLSTSQYSPAVLEKCCLVEITRAALGLAQDRIYLAGVKVNEKMKSPCYIYGDQEKLQIAILNIMVNASEAMLPEKGVLNIRIRRSGNLYKLTISDNGCGMDQEQLDRLFESFYTQKPEGMGIGLSSVKNILEEHDAAVDVKSKPRQGTTFILSFPSYESLVGN